MSMFSFVAVFASPSRQSDESEQNVRSTLEMRKGWNAQAR